MLVFESSLDVGFASAPRLRREVGVDRDVEEESERGAGGMANSGEPCAREPRSGWMNWMHLALRTSPDSTVVGAMCMSGADCAGA